jgi:predicted amidohydrolase
VKLFLSFHKADLEFARWIAWNAERTGCDVVIQELDMASGTDFVGQARPIAVWSPAYLSALSAHPEWAEFLRQPGSIVVRVAECDAEALLNERAPVDLFGCEEGEARRRLLAALRGARRKPKRAPRFPETRFPGSGGPAVAGQGWSADGRNALEVLADLYHVARRRSNELLQLHVDADAWRRYHEIRKEAGKALAVDSRLTVRMKQPLPPPDGDPAALAAALDAMAAACRSRLWEAGPVSIRTSAALGSVEYRVTPDDSPFAGDFPRHAEELSATLESLYLADIRLIPAESQGFALTPVRLAAAGRLRLRDCRESRAIRIGLSSLGGGAEFAGEAMPGFPEGEPRRFRLTGLRNGTAEQENLLTILRQAAERGAAILVLPELRVTPSMEGAAREFLAKGGHSLALVIAGSWHYAVDDNGWVNRCSVLGARGEVVWEHCKLREYRATAENVAAAAQFYAGIGLDENGGSEGILRGRALQYCDTPIGRLCVAICMGFFHPEAQPALAETRADYFLVPAMTARAVDLHRTADQPARLWAATLVANCGVVGHGGAPSFWRKPLRKEAVREADADLVFVDFNLR